MHIKPTVINYRATLIAVASSAVDCLPQSKPASRTERKLCAEKKRAIPSKDTVSSATVIV